MKCGEGQETAAGTNIPGPGGPGCDDRKQHNVKNRWTRKSSIQKAGDGEGEAVTHAPGIVASDGQGARVFKHWERMLGALEGKGGTLPNNRCVVSHGRGAQRPALTDSQGAKKKKKRGTLLVRSKTQKWAARR